MPNANTVILMGHLTRDPEVKTLQSGTTVGKFGLAVNDGYGDKQYVSFIDVTIEILKRIKEGKNVKSS